MNSTAERTTRKATVTTPTDRTIYIERIFDAPRDRVWRAYTQPELLAQWWGRGNKVVIEKYEAERGGHWRVVEHGPGGPHGFEGRFRDHPARPHRPDVRVGRDAGLRDPRDRGVRGPGGWADEGAEYLAVLHDRGAGRDAELGDGGWAQRELRRARSAAGDDRVRRGI